MDYTRSKPGADVGRLRDELAAAALPVVQVRGPDQAGDIVVTMSVDLDALELETMDNVIDAHDGRKRQPRTIDAVYTDLAALTGQQKANIWQYLTQPVDGKQRWRQSNDGALWNAANVGNFAPAGGALQDQSRALTGTFWCIEHPSDFVNPPFDPSINVPGDEVA